MQPEEEVQCCRHGSGPRPVVLRAATAGSHRAGSRKLTDHKHRNPPAIRGTGYVVQSLEAALWAFHRGASFRDGALLAFNLGDDADTTGAVYGQLAGAFYGEQGIPETWRARLALRERIIAFADQLCGLAEKQEERYPQR
jgi:ADP-ribosylglycohydrolase